MLTLFQQIVAGDSWGLISIPVMEAAPWPGIVLPLVQLFIAMGLMNLILAVVVDRSVDAREQNKERVLEEKRRQKEERRLQLLSNIAFFDTDASGTLSREEILRAFQNSPDIKQILSLADIGTQDLEQILDALEAESFNGEVSYERLCTVIHEIESIDLRKLSVVGHLTRNSQHLEHDRILLNLTQMLERLIQANARTMGESIRRLERKMDDLPVRLVGQSSLLGQSSLSFPSDGMLSHLTNSKPTYDESPIKKAVDVDGNGTNGISISIADIGNFQKASTAQAADKDKGSLSDSVEVFKMSPDLFLDDICEMHSRLLFDLKELTVEFSSKLEASQQRHENRLMHRLRRNPKDKVAIRQLTITSLSSRSQVFDAQVADTAQKSDEACPHNSKVSSEAPRPGMPGRSISRRSVESDTSPGKAPRELSRELTPKELSRDLTPKELSRDVTANSRNSRTESSI